MCEDLQVKNAKRIGKKNSWVGKLVWCSSGALRAEQVYLNHGTDEGTIFAGLMYAAYPWYKAMGCKFLPQTISVAQ